MSHLGDPCIHCDIPHDAVEPGPCQNSTGFAATIRRFHFYQAALKKHTEDAARETTRLNNAIASERVEIALATDGLDVEKIALAKTVVFASDFSRGGAERESARQDAIAWFATGKAGYLGLRREFFGTKDYDRWRGQRCDCEYGYGPRHGSIVFQIGLCADARKRDLTEAEKDAAIYYLTNLERIQDQERKAVQP